MVGKLLNPRNDYTFKRIFGKKGNEEITKGLIGAIMQKEIKEINLDKNKILERDLLTDKLGILDIRATIDEGTECDIEVQIVDYKDIQERILFYWSKLYCRGIVKGGNYKELKKVIIILITGYEIEELRELEKMISKWQIREENNHNKVLTDKLEFYILELPKYRRYKDENEELNNWVKFIERPEEIGMKEMKDKNIKKAMEELEGMSLDEYEQDMALRREMFLHDQESMKTHAYEDGEKTGKNSAKIEIAKKMIKAGKPLKEIIEFTGITKEEIEKLK